MDYVNECELCVFGMKRSGHHAVINWIMDQAPRKSCFLNNLERYNENPWLLVLEDPARRNFFYNTPYEGKNQYDLEEEYRGNWKFKKYLVYSYEDVPLEFIVDNNFRRNHDEFVGKSGSILFIMVLRDPYNTFASRLRTGFTCKIDCINMWKEYAQEYIEGGKTLPKENTIFVSFNKWFKDKKYRKDLAEKIELEFTDAGLNKVVKNYRGSSFDGTMYNGKAQKMKVLERWKHYQNDSKYRKIFEDKELVEMSERIFGKIVNWS